MSLLCILYRGRTREIHIKIFRFVRELLDVPSFSRNSTTSAHFDQKIAENVARVLETILAMDIDSLQGNTTVAKVLHFF